MIFKLTLILFFSGCFSKKYFAKRSAASSVFILFFFSFCLYSSVPKQKKSLDTKKNEHDDSWTGNLHSTKFVTPAEDLIENFDSSIKAMNENIDKLLNKINEYENKAMEQDGFIGQLGILLNNISGWFESFVN